MMWFGSGLSGDMVDLRAGPHIAFVVNGGEVSCGESWAALLVLAANLLDSLDCGMPEEDQMWG